MRPSSRDVPLRGRSGDLGPRRERREGEDRNANDEAARKAEAARLAQIPVLVAADRPPAEWIVRAGSRRGDFGAQQVARVISQPSTLSDVALSPFYRTHRRNYSVYFDILTPEEFEARAREVKE